MQALVDKENGDCQRAVLASLFEVELEGVPIQVADPLVGLSEDDIRAIIKKHNGEEFSNYPMEKIKGYAAVCHQMEAIEKFIESKGHPHFNPMGTRNSKRSVLLEALKLDGGINGFFYAIVPSQTYEGVTHAVVIDLEGNIVHDPNPNQKALEFTFDDVILVYGNNVDLVMTDEGAMLYEDYMGKKKRKKNDSKS